MSAVKNSTGSAINEQHPRGVIAVVGPTASGKSTLGIKLALQIGGEIINCDSVQVYSGIQIATAKVPYQEREGIPHHLIDFVSPEINYTAGEWAREAATKIEEIERRGNVPILVGGTGLYLRALRNPFFHSPPTDEQLRRRLNMLRERRGPEHLHRLLHRLDPKSAKELYPRDWPRVQRAIEVRLQTGSPMSDQKAKRPVAHDSTGSMRIFVLNPPRTELYARINERTEQHFEAGLVEEVESLIAQGVPKDSNALGAHGYRRVVEYLEGKHDLRSAIEQTKTDVRRYSKRQLTWFRREAGVEWCGGFGEEMSTQQAVLNAIEYPREIEKSSFSA
ncbi:MAG TPA: tRNA (adenosine(37)-N6)-dimethylallyltransferase MiaA [Pyrinomonadaceae bacterium]|nr:tRNA (adenosine(37)-N6)-dimethylallyltransferase MiaA [Pyrinomonadaceae bacterium]